MSNNSQSGNIAIWVAVITVLGGIVVAFINMNGSSDSGGGSSIESVCERAQFSVEGDDSTINCSN
jgi:hypothetical protein